MKKKTKREIIWIIIMIAGLIIFFTTGCGSKETLTERVITEVEYPKASETKTESKHLLEKN